jgi:hypothetical protein
MSTNWNFSNNLSIPNSMFLKFLDTTGVTKHNILGLDASSNINLNSGVGDMYINSNSIDGSNLFFNVSNSKNVLINSKLAVGINSTSNLTSNIVLPLNGWIGLNSTQGAHTGYLGLGGSSSLNNTSGSRMQLYGIDAISGNAGMLNMYTGKNAGNVQIYTGDDLLRFQVLNSGTSNFQPDGTTIRLSIADNNTTLTNTVILTNTVVSTSSTTGALQIAGGIGIQGNSYINGTLTINSLIGNINFSSSTVSTGYTSGATYFVGGIGIECSVAAISQYNGGGLSVAGGLALGQNAMLGGNITVFNSNVSTSAISGSGIFYGGIGVNGQINIRSNSTSQIKMTPVVTGDETSIYFGNQNNYTTVGSWIIGQNINSVGSGNFGISSNDNGLYIEFIGNTIKLDKYTQVLNTLNFNNNTINDLIIFNSTQGNTQWSMGRIINNISGDFQISRFTQGNFINYLLTSDVKTGNINILGTENSISSISGGSLTINGGTSIAKDLYIGGNINGGNINFSGNLVSQSISDSNIFSYVTLTATDLSINSTTGALITFGGITIQAELDTVSSTNGGSFLVMGGASINKSLIIGDTVNSTAISSVNAIITNSSIANMNSTSFTTTSLLATTNISTGILYATSSIINTITTSSLLATTNISTGILYATSSTIGHIVSTTATIPNIILTNITTTNIIITSGSLNATFNSNTLGNIYTTGGNVGINVIPNAPLQFISDTASRKIVLYDTFNNNHQFYGYGMGSGLMRYQVGGTGSDHVFFAGVNSTTSNELFRIKGTGNVILGGSISSGSLYSTNLTSSNIVSTTATIPNITFTNVTTESLLATTNISTGLLSVTNIIGINTTTTTLLVTSFAKLSFNSNTLGNIYTTGGNVGINNVSPIFTLDITGSGQFTDKFTASFNSNTLGNIYTTGGNVGINNVSPNFTLDITGSGRFTNKLTAAFNSNTLGSLYTTGGSVGINNTKPNQKLEVSTISYAINQDGGIRVSTNDYISTTDISYRYIDLRLKSNNSTNFKGAIIGTLNGGIGSEYEYMSFNQAGTISINGPTHFYDSTSSISSITGSVLLEGGLAINNDVNATDINNGGALTVKGGVAVSNDVYIGGDLTVTGSILYANAAAASSTFAYLTLTATDGAINGSTGALVVAGGILSQSNINATSSTAGGGLLISGGGAIKLDLYVGGTSYLTSILSTDASVTNSTVTNLIVTNGIKGIFNSNTIGNIFTTGGNVGINTVSPQRRFQVDNNMRIGGSGSVLDFGDDTTTQIYRNSTLSELRFTTNSLDRITISSTGNIGIGNINPTFILDITGSVNLRSTTVSDNSTSGTFISAGGISISKTSNSTSTTSGGALTIAGGLAVFKDVYVGGTVTSSSDKRLKKNIRPITNVLNKIDTIRTVKYNSINESDKRDYVGFLAQDFEKHFPELISRNNENALYSLGYDRVTVILMQCIKELKEQNIQLINRINKIEQK